MGVVVAFVGFAVAPDGDRVFLVGAFEGLGVFFVYVGAFVGAFEDIVGATDGDKESPKLVGFSVGVLVASVGGRVGEPEG